MKMKQKITRKSKPIINLIRPKYFDSRFDIVMAGNIFEHLRKSESIDLLNFLIYRSRWIIVEFPHRYLQNAVDGYGSEAHISVWADNVFFRLKELVCTQKIHNGSSFFGVI